MSEYKTIYEVTDEWVKMYGFLILLMALGGVRTFKYHLRSKDTMSRGRQIYLIVFGWFWIIATSIAACFVITYHTIEYFDTKELYEQKHYQVIEGIVENFEPVPKGGRGQESFTVNKVKFAYSDTNESYYGFNQTKVYGGPMDEGKQVRISYYNNGRQNIILKLEVREKPPK